MLLDFVNGRGLTHDQFKIVVVPPRLWQRRSSPRYYLIYRSEEPEGALVGALEQQRDAVKAAVMCEDAACTVHLASLMGQLTPLPPGQIDALYRRYQEEYGQR